MGKADIVIGLDIGTSKICAMVGRDGGDGHVEILGLGLSPSNGLRKGAVVNLEHTIRSIKQAVEEARHVSGVSIGSVFAGIAGGHIEGFNTRGMVPVARKDKEITQEDVDRVIDTAQAVKISPDREVLHVLPQGYIVDDQDGIQDPIGMLGVRLQADVHIVTGAVTSAQNIIKCVQRAGCDVEDLVLQPLASSDAVLSNEEKSLGVAVIDMGAGTTDLIVYVNGAVRHSKVLPVGGDHITKDISVGLRTPESEAEEIKKKYGCALTSLVARDEKLVVGSVGGRKQRDLLRRDLSEIIEPRMEEMFYIIRHELEMSNYQDLIAAGIVVTGGASLLPGTVPLAEKIFRCPVRLGFPENVRSEVNDVNSPIFSTSVGLVKQGLDFRRRGKTGKFSDGNPFAKWIRWLMDRFGEFF